MSYFHEKRIQIFHICSYLCYKAAITSNLWFWQAYVVGEIFLLCQNKNSPHILIHSTSSGLDPWKFVKIQIVLICVLWKHVMSIFFRKKIV